MELLKKIHFKQMEINGINYGNRKTTGEL
jgi:hypothetical protein